MAIICRKVGNSITATIPIEIAKNLGIAPGDTLDVSNDGKSVVFTPIKKKLKGECFLEQYYKRPIDKIDSLDTEIVDWGAPQGEEEW